MQFNDGIRSRLIGTVQQIADRILLFKSLGIDHLLTAFLDFDTELPEFGRKVIPLVKQLESEGRGVDAEYEIALSGSIYQ